MSTTWSAVWLVGWLVGWLDDLLVGWLVGWLLLLLSYFRGLYQTVGLKELASLTTLAIYIYELYHQLRRFHVWALSSATTMIYIGSISSYDDDI